jgi:hypothetical protein
VNVRACQLARQWSLGAGKGHEDEAPNYHNILNSLQVQIHTLLPNGVGKMWGEALHKSLLAASDNGGLKNLIIHFNQKFTAVEALAQECEHLCHIINNEVHELFNEALMLSQILTKAENILGELILYSERNLEDYMEAWAKGQLIWQS